MNGPAAVRSAVVDRERVDQLFALLARYVRLLRELATTPPEEFIGDPRAYGSAERFLQLAIETTLSIGNHLISAEGLEQPRTYAEVFTILGRTGVVQPQLAARLEPMARMRNRLVHVYEDVDARVVLQVIAHELDDFDHFAAAVTRHLDALERRDAEDGLQ